MRAKNLILVIVCFVCSLLFSPLAQGAFVCIDSSCVGCHVLPTSAINVALTHPNLTVGCITCHSPECVPGLHKDGIRQLDPLYYSYTGTAANVGCNVCHGAPPQALCAGSGSLVMDHCLDPAGCNPEIFNCIACHPNFNGLANHIYPKVLGVPLFATVASVGKCMACHSLSLLVGRSGAHTTHFVSKIIAPATTASKVLSIDCAVCHPNLAANLGADHVVCIHGASNAWLPGKVPVIFNALLGPIGDGDFYSLGPVGGTGTCVVYCHSNGQTPPTTLLTAALGYPGSNLPLPWNVPFPIDPLILDCGCCHAFPPLTHSASKTDCNTCHPTPVLGAAPTSTYHINGIPDLWRLILSASPAVPLILPSSSSVSGNDLILSSALGIDKFLGLPGMGLTAPALFGSGTGLLSALGMTGLGYNPIMTASLNITSSLPLTDYLLSPSGLGLPLSPASSSWSSFSNGPGIPGWRSTGLASPWNYLSSPTTWPGFGFTATVAGGFTNPLLSFGWAGLPFYW
ncbi:MAG: CxxxxCH/CxxCH domain-containing protein [bacterium]